LGFKRLDPGSGGSRRYTRKKAQIAADWCKSGGCRSLFGRDNGVACLGETSGLCGKRTLPPLGTGSRVIPPHQTATRFGGDPVKSPQRIVTDPSRTPIARDDTVDSVVDLFQGNHFTIPPFHLKNTFPPSKMQSSVFCSHSAFPQLTPEELLQPEDFECLAQVFATQFQDIDPGCQRLALSICAVPFQVLDAALGCQGEFAQHLATQVEDAQAVGSGILAGIAAYLHGTPEGIGMAAEGGLQARSEGICGRNQGMQDRQVLGEEGADFILQHEIEGKTQQDQAAVAVHPDRRGQAVVWPAAGNLRRVEGLAASGKHIAHGQHAVPGRGQLGGVGVQVRPGGGLGGYEDRAVVEQGLDARQKAGEEAGVELAGILPSGDHQLAAAEHVAAQCVEVVDELHVREVVAVPEHQGMVAERFQGRRALAGQIPIAVPEFAQDVGVEVVHHLIRGRDVGAVAVTGLIHHQKAAVEGEVQRSGLQGV